MNKQDELTQRDWRLLELIDRIVMDGDSEQQEIHSLYGFSAHLAGAKPRAAPTFRQQLEARLIAEFPQQRECPGSSVADRGRSQGHSLCRFLHWTPGASLVGQLFRAGADMTMSKRITLVAIVTLVVVFSTVAFVPSVRAQIGGMVRQIALGAYTKAVQVISRDDSSSQALPPDTWIIRTECGNFCGNAPPGVDPTVRSLASFEEAQVATDYHLKAPISLPKGYSLHEIMLAPIGGTHWVLLIYAGGNHDIVIAQMPGGPRPTNDPHALSSTMSGILTDGTLEEVDFDGRPAAWTDDRSLLWESDGISYLVCSLDLGLEQALEMARSLR